MNCQRLGSSYTRNRSSLNRERFPPMIRKVFQLALLGTVLAFSATSANAQSASWYSSSGGSSGGSSSGGSSSGGSSGGGVPEVDPATIGSALALLCGGALMLTDRIRRK